jgi:hypothetical protein
VNAIRTQAMLQLEKATRPFRENLARGHRRRWTAEQRRGQAALDAWDPTLEAGELTGELAPPRMRRDSRGLWFANEPMRRDTETVTAVMVDARSVEHWHRGRDNGQKFRFRNLHRCGTRYMVAQCRACDTERTPVLEGCGIARLCVRCSLAHAKRRRARFGRARARVSRLLALIGYTRTRRKQAPPLGGLWSDKMVTLTVPHFLVCHVEEGAALLGFAKGGAEVDATMARIFAVRAAWPLFARSLRRWFKLGGTLEKPRKRDVRRQSIGMPLVDGTIVPPPMHRAFEWTAGGDGLGHPHFHVWMIAPFIPATTIAIMWREALIAVGVPIAADSYVRVHIKRFRDFDGAAVGELLKGGTRKSLEFSRLYKHGPSNAFEYADGWTIAAALEEADPSVVASLYMALEGSRLTQASAGFFEADERPACPTCSTQGCWHVRFDTIHDDDKKPAAAPAHERGPPWQQPNK